MAAGFVHGVLNTDNMNVTGESFDYGPYRFLPTYDPDFTAAYFDHGGLYAFGRQPATVLWNLERLADALRRSAPARRARSGARRASSRPSGPRSRDAFLAPPRRSARRGPDEDAALVRAPCSRSSSESRVGYDRFFFDWYGGAASAARARRSPAADALRRRALRARSASPRRASPPRPSGSTTAYFQRHGPCTLLIDEIEALWAAIAERDDWAPFEAKLDAIDELRRAVAG